MTSNNLPRGNENVLFELEMTPLVNNFSTNNDLSKYDTSTTVWMDSEEAAFFLRTNVKTLLNLCNSGKIPYYKFGRLNRYKRNELEQMLECQKRGPLK